MKIFFVVPDYYEKRPKKCMNGWGNVFLTVTPDGTALPCHTASPLRTACSVSMASARSGRDNLIRSASGKLTWL